jgi:predicted nucleic acid-binding protein
MATKKIVLCDTNIIIELLKGTPEVVYNIERIGIDSIYISSITAGELYFGALNKNELVKIRKHIESVVHIPLNESISDIFVTLMIKYSLSHKLSIPDAIIAATAIFYEIELYTFNLKDFRYIEDIVLYTEYK